MLNLVPKNLLSLIQRKGKAQGLKPNDDLPCKPLDWREHKLLENGVAGQDGGGLKDLIKTFERDSLQPHEMIEQVASYYRNRGWDDLADVVEKWAQLHGIVP